MVIIQDTTAGGLNTMSEYFNKPIFKPHGDEYLINRKDMIKVIQLISALELGTHIMTVDKKTSEEMDVMHEFSIFCKYNLHYLVVQDMD